MEQPNHPINRLELSLLCRTVKRLIGKESYQECYRLIQNAMGKYPHAPEPHNLIGLLLEQEGNYSLAMKHFRAAWALDPTYLPARSNLYRFGNLSSEGNIAFEEADCTEESKPILHKIEYDDHGIGHVVRRY